MISRLMPPPLELWGGIECTLNRVGDAYFDQLEWNGHAVRPDDLDRIAELGIRTLRYPVSWERVAPNHGNDSQWEWTDERLARLRCLGIRPIVGLVHHGSGPSYTSLLDPGFAEGLGAFAGRAAERYPWVQDYTPVNEPLTTARFSGMYGLWYPHGRDPLSFARALLSECRATVLAMQAVRAVRPDARLVQTEDLGKTYSTPGLAYQAEFDNERRWVSFDLLSGRLQSRDLLWKFFRKVGIEERELAWFQDHPCPPDIVGINHYVTSDRFLDERLDRYPPCSHGGNHRQAYADVEAVRVYPQGLQGVGALLREAWERYHLPLAVTEAHLACTREEQMRWLLDVWRSAQAVREKGVDVRAVTAWSLLGAFNWNSLVTRDEGYYEPGAFDLRGPSPRPTALANLLQELAAGNEPDHPALDTPGWWRRPMRLTYPAPAAPGSVIPRFDGRAMEARPGVRPIVITGATGTLGRAFARLCDERGLVYRLLNRQGMDIADARAVSAALEKFDPWAVINAAGHVRVDDAEREPMRCGRENTTGPVVLAEACGLRGIPLLTFSSDLVFDGQRRSPYCESHPTAPLGVYGRTKAEAERQVLKRYPDALVVRTGAFFGPWDEYNFVTLALQALRNRASFTAADDLVVSPTYVPDLVNACLDLLLDGECGVWHLSNQGETTWAEFAREAARRSGLKPAAVIGQPAVTFGWSAPRPPYSVLGSERGALLPPLDHALTRYCSQRQAQGVHAPLNAHEGCGALAPHSAGDLPTGVVA